MKLSNQREAFRFLLIKAAGRIKRKQIPLNASSIKNHLIHQHKYSRNKSKTSQRDAGLLLSSSVKFQRFWENRLSNAGRNKFAFGVTKKKWSSMIILSLYILCAHIQLQSDDVALKSGNAWFGKHVTYELYK